MKTKYLFAGLSVAALALLSGCAGNVNAKASIDYANDHKTIAEEAKVEPAQTESANAKLESASKLEAEGENEKAAALAEESALEYKLAVANTELSAAKAEDEKFEKELRGDVERKLIYQSILDQETKNGGAK